MKRAERRGWEKKYSRFMEVMEEGRARHPKHKGEGKGKEKKK